MPRSNSMTQIKAILAEEAKARAPQLEMAKLINSFIPQIINGQIKKENIAIELITLIEKARNSETYKDKELELLDRLINLIDEINKKRKEANEKSQKYLKYVQKKIAEVILKDINLHHSKDFSLKELEGFQSVQKVNKLFSTSEGFDKINSIKLDLAERIAKKLQPYLNKNGKVAQECAELLSNSNVYYQNIGTAITLKNLSMRRSISLPKLSTPEISQLGENSLYKSPTVPNLQTYGSDDKKATDNDPATPRGSFGKK